MLKKNNKNDFLEKTKAAREERQLEKTRHENAVKIQTMARAWLARLHVKKLINKRFDDLFPVLEAGKEAKITQPAVQMYKVAKLFITFFNTRKDESRFELMMKYIIASVQLESPKLSFIGVFLNKEYSVSWIQLVKDLCTNCTSILAHLPPNLSTFNKTVAFYSLALITFTSSSTWGVVRHKAVAPLAPHLNQLCHNICGHLVDRGLFSDMKTLLLNGIATSTVTLKKTSLSAINNLCLRPVIYSNFSDKLVSLYILNILCVPALVHQISKLCGDFTSQLKNHQVLKLCIQLLAQEQQLRIHFNALEGSYALCLAGNLINLIEFQDNDSVQEFLLDLVLVLTRLLESCAKYVTAKQSNLSHWHPVLGWFSVSLDKHLQATIPLVKQQISKLWQPAAVKLVTHHLQECTVHLSPPSPLPTPAPEEDSAAKKLVKQAIEKTKSTYATTQVLMNSSTVTVTNRLGNPDCRKISFVCAMYETAVRTLSQLRLEILTGLCYGDILLKPLWLFINSLGPNCGLKSFLDLLNINKNGNSPEFQMLTLFCDTLSHLVTILDDKEFYESGNPFQVHEYAILAQFINQFLFKGVWSGVLTDPEIPLFVSMHNLLAALRRRDERKSFTSQNFWLVKDLKINQLTTDLTKGKKSARIIKQRMPHVIPHKDRVLMFRNEVHQDRITLGIIENESVTPQSTLITVHRNRLVEDGYRQLANLSSTAMKGLIRVKFVNLQGLDEAGIDQDGVFKEFLEETIKKVFDPGLNLFTSTSEERLFPSPLSHMTDNHLDLFEFVGRMIGKAVYEGIVVDVPFAAFFLTQVLGNDHSALYSYLDEMASADPELYKNLTYVKHYEGDVEDLGLTFSFDQDVLGRIISHELVPGGRSINVTNENRILYIHMMAHFKMHKQIQNQVAAFRRGFRTVVPFDWLSVFSGQEVQRLISGDNSPIDLKDLRRNTSYYGGFHDSHKVIVWLWDILEKDFNDKEKGSFLKFVTSCSKPPLLGFYNLEPPFSIRCVEVAEDEDDGDTLGSVLRGFLALKKKDPVNRLPTASTCFNLLKLPNYQKKSTLRDKLRYAITCNTGFELS